MTGYAWILVSIYTYQLKMLIETDEKPLSEGSGEKKQNVYRKDSSSNSVKDHLAHCAHGRTPNELQSVPEVKNSNYYGSEKMKTISMRWS